MKPGVLCLLLLSGCSNFWFPEDARPEIVEYALTWTCVSVEGCERTADVSQIDHLTLSNDFYDFYFTSTQDPSFGADALRVTADVLGRGCFFLYFLTLFDHELERAPGCLTPGGFESEISIPNADPATHSRWLLTARDLSLL
jgi:hypothetical protein